MRDLRAKFSEVGELVSYSPESRTWIPTCKCAWGSATLPRVSLISTPVGFASFPRLRAAKPVFWGAVGEENCGAYVTAPWAKKIASMHLAF